MKKKQNFKNIVKEKECIKCLNCCYFSKEEEKMLPFLSLDESKKFLSKESIKKRANGFFQIISKKSYKYKNLKKCIFLQESSHRCKIYNTRPLECVIWPFLLVRYARGIFISVVNKEWCPQVSSKKINDKNLLNSLISFLKKTKVLDEIKKGERYVWPEEDFYIKLRDLKNYTKK